MLEELKASLRSTFLFHCMFYFQRTVSLTDVLLSRYICCKMAECLVVGTNLAALSMSKLLGLFRSLQPHCNKLFSTPLFTRLDTGV